MRTRSDRFLPPGRQGQSAPSRRLPKRSDKEVINIRLTRGTLKRLIEGLDSGSPDARLVLRKMLIKYLDHPEWVSRHESRIRKALAS